jgi:tetratricopeptide (TPR) repeat protein
MSSDFESARRLLEQHKSESATLGRRYAAASEFVKALEALKTNHREIGVDILSNSSAPDPIALHYLAGAQMEQENWAAASEALRRLLENRGHILQEGVPTLIPLSEYRLGLCERHLGQFEAGNARIKKVEQLWHKADPEIRQLLH